jgi:hypothetical protein
MSAPRLSSGEAVLLLRAVWVTLRTELKQREGATNSDAGIARMIDDRDTGFDLMSQVLGARETATDERASRSSCAR